MGSTSFAGFRDLVFQDDALQRELRSETGGWEPFAALCTSLAAARGCVLDPGDLVQARDMSHRASVDRGAPRVGSPAAPDRASAGADRTSAGADRTSAGAEGSVSRLNASFARPEESSSRPAVGLAPPDEHVPLGWTPIDFVMTADGPRVDWCDLRGLGFDGPFFEDTVRRGLREPYRLVFRPRTGVSALEAIAGRADRLELGGLIFHASRCGSTLAAAVLGQTAGTVVLSEPGVLDRVLRAPGVDEATREHWLGLIVTALCQRREPGERRVVIKLDAWATRHLGLVRRTFARVPWVFIYRDPAEIVASQMHQPGWPAVPGMLEPELFGLDLAGALALAAEDYTARVVGTICEDALGELAGGGYAVHYAELPSAIWSRIVPRFGIGLGPGDGGRMRAAGERDAKRPYQGFDVATAVRPMTPAIRAAAERWAGPAYRGLEAWRAGQDDEALRRLRRARLSLGFDPQPLRGDVDRLRPEDWVAHFNTDYYEGEWSGVPLRSVGGRARQLYPDPTAADSYADTEFLAGAPSLREAIAGFECELRSVRLLRLSPGSSILEHRDYDLGYELGEVRIHVPLTTNTEVEFLLDGEPVEMAAGEVWYLDLSLPHAVANRGATDRVHLVVDCVVNPWLDRQLTAAADAQATAAADAQATAAADAQATRVATGLSRPAGQAAGPAPPVVPITAQSAPLGVPQLERLRRSAVTEAGRATVALGAEEFALTRAVLDCLGVGLEPVVGHLFAALPSAGELERWILAQVGGAVDPVRIARAQAIASGGEPDAGRRAELDRLERADPVLSGEDLAFWEENGYVVLVDAAPPGACAALERAIWEHLQASPADPASWYPASLRVGGKVPVFHAPGIAEIHGSRRIHKAFAQLAGTPDLVMSTDRCSFDPPLRAGSSSPAGRLSLDLDSFAPPVSPRLCGILYLTDTDEDQGAFRCVPGFQHRVDAWLAALPEGRDPNTEDFEGLGPRAVPGPGGSLVIWSAALPHGTAPNTAGRPVIGHFLTMYPTPRPPVAGT